MSANKVFKQDHIYVYMKNVGNPVISFPNWVLKAIKVKLKF